MPVYVDDMYLSNMGRFGRMKMSHMIADSTEELLGMVKIIGLNEKWIQQSGTYMEHFDVSMSLRSKALKAGAVAITMRELVVKCQARNG